MNRRALILALALFTAGLTAGCSDDEEKPLSPDTGRDLETPSSTVSPPTPPPQ